MSASIVHPVGSNNVPVKTSLSGHMAVQSTFNTGKFPVRVRITDAVGGIQLENIPGAYTWIHNPPDNDVIFVGSIGDDQPYMNKNYAGDHRGIPVYPGQNFPVMLDNASKIRIVGTLNQDIYYYTPLNQPQDVVTAQAGPAFIDTTPPTISSVIPANAATNVARNTDVFVIASENIDPASVTAAHVSISPAVSGSAFLDTVNHAKVWVRSAQTLAGATTYTITVTGLKDVGGNTQVGTFTSTFTTVAAAPPPDTTPPTISSKTPDTGATGVSISVNPQIVFSEAMLSSTINTTNIQLLNNVNANVTIAVSLNSSDQKTVTVTPNGSLNYGQQYTLKVTTGVKDLAGNAMAAQQTWMFSTAARTLTLIYNVAGTDYNQINGSGDTVEALYINNSSSTMRNHVPRKVVVTMKKSGSPTGNITCEIYDTSGDFVVQIGNAISAASLTGSDATYTFEDDSNSTALQTNYALGIKYEGGSSSNYVNIKRDGNGSYDGSNTIRTKYSGSWYRDTARDFAASIYE